MKNLSVIAAILCLVLSSTASFADKVVVIPLGKTVNIEASINWLGEWTDSTDYYEGDAIQYQGSSYLCIQEHVSENPPPHANWDLMASKGGQGDTGEQGIQGPQGASGIDGTDGAQGAPGADGADGSPGITGADGADGVQGIKGEKGDTGAAGSGAVKVYDADDNYLGIYMGVYEIFNPTTNSILRLGASTGEISPVLRVWLYYPQPDCQGDWFITVGDAEGRHGVLLRVGNQYFSIPLFPVVTEDVWTSSRRSYDSSSDVMGDCINDNSTFDSPQATFYTEAEVGFTFPLSFPLRFEVAP